MACSIFISYRRKDAGGYAQLVMERLASWFGADALFFDRKDLNPGEDFTQEIQQAIHSARVTLALIGPDWLAEINRRSRLTDGSSDVVRLELALALSRQKTGKDVHQVFPVLVGQASMPGGEQFEAPAVRADLAALCAPHAAALQGDLAAWNLGFWQLARQLTAALGVLPVAGASDVQRANQAAAKVRTCLAAPHMASLVKAWKTDDPLAGFSGQGVDQLFRGLFQAVKAAQPDWLNQTLSADRLAAVKRDCTEIVSQLALLAVSGPAARLWLEGGTAAVMPVMTPEALALVCAAYHGRAQPVSFKARQVNRFRAPGVVDLAEPDNGINLRRRGAFEGELWRTVMPPEERFPASDERPLGAELREQLKTAIETLRFLDDRQFIVTDAVPHGQAVPQELLQFATEYGLDPLARTGQETSGPDALFSGMTEKQLLSHVYFCLHQIESIK
jgi:TIR domain